MQEIKNHYKLVCLIGAIIIVIALCVAGISACEFPNEEEEVKCLYEISENANAGFETFTNLREGYCLSVPAGMQVDMSYSNIRTLIYDDDTRIEIYSQSLEGTDADVYISYSNGFMDTAAAAEDIVINLNEYIDNNHISIFEREALPRLSKDHNYYANIDIPDMENNVVYSIFVKSSKEITAYDDIAYITESFETCYGDDSIEPYIRTSMTTPVMERGWSIETAAWYEKHFGDMREGGTEFGIFEPNASRLHFERLAEYEEDFDYEFPVLLNYSQFADELHPDLVDRLEKTWADNEKVLELTLQVTEQESGNMMYDILKGKYDDFLHYYARTIADFGHPVMFRPFNEMNGDWCIYSAYHTAKDTDIYIEAYKYIYEIFRKEGALDNTIWIWNPNHMSFPNYDWNHALMYYPGDEYVDVIGMTAYNTGSYYIDLGESWQEFGDLYDGLYADYREWFSQPLMITEFACADFGGDKPKWIENMFRRMADYPRICMAIWWDGCDWDVYGNVARSYFLDSTPEVTESFALGLKGAYDDMTEPIYGTGYSKKHLNEVLEELRADSDAAFKEGLTIEEYRGVGNDDTRPDWLVDLGDGKFGYSKEKYKELKNIRKEDK